MEDAADWTSDEIADLVANLDDIAETNQPTKLSPMLSKEVFWKKLQESLVNARPLDQVIHKLQEYVEGDFNQVYAYGSRCMKLDADMKRAVVSKLVAIRVSTPRQLRSNSRKRLRSDRFSVTPAPSFSAKSVGPSARRLKRLRGDSMAKLAARQDSPRSRSRLTSELPNTSTVSSEDELQVHPSFEICSEEESDGSHNLSPIPSLQASSRSFKNANEPRRLQIIDCNTVGPILRVCEEDVPDCSHETLQDILNDNMYFRERVAELTKLNKRLNHELRVLRSDFRVQNGELGSQTLGPLNSLCKRIAELESGMNDGQQLVKTCLKSKPENRDPLPNRKQIESSIYEMGRVLESLPNRKEFRYPQTDHLKQESNKDLRELLGRVFVDVQESALLPYLRSQVSVGSLVQAIVGTAVCRWVFESELRCAAMVKTPLLEAFRLRMSTIPDGEAAFQSLYLTAHRLVITDNHFKRAYLPRTATKLAGRLVDALGPLIKTKKRGRRMITLKKDFESIFQHALDVKTEVIAGEHMFGTIWPSCGSAYERILMKTELAGDGPGHGETSGCVPLKVKLPRVPGLRFYSHEKMSFDYCSFTNGDDSDWGKSKSLCQAVVAI